MIFPAKYLVFGTGFFFPPQFSLKVHRRNVLIFFKIQYKWRFSLILKINFYQPLQFFNGGGTVLERISRAYKSGVSNSIVVFVYCENIFLILYERSFSKSDQNSNKICSQYKVSVDVGKLGSWDDFETFSFSFIYLL